MRFLCWLGLALNGGPPFAAGTVIVSSTPNAQWVWPIMVRPIFVYPIKVQPILVEFGHVRTGDPTTSTDIS